MGAEVPISGEDPNTLVSLRHKAELRREIERVDSGLRRETMLKNQLRSLQNEMQSTLDPAGNVLINCFKVCQLIALK